MVTCTSVGAFDGWRTQPGGGSCSLQGPWLGFAEDRAGESVVDRESDEESEILSAKDQCAVKGLERETPTANSSDNHRDCIIQI